MRGRSGLLTGKSADGVKKVAGEFHLYLSQKSFVEPLFDVESLPLVCIVNYLWFVFLLDGEYRMIGLNV